MPIRFLMLYKLGKVEEALSYLSENWLIYSYLPMWARDDEQISITAILRNAEASFNMSPRLKRDIRFFEKAFNQFTPYAKIELKTGRDTFLMLAYAHEAKGYRHKVTRDDVAAIFPLQDTDIEYSVAQQLLSETDKWREWPINRKQECVEKLSVSVPGLASFCYEYAYYLGYCKCARYERSQFI